MPKAINHIVSALLPISMLAGGPYSLRPWETDKKFKDMIAHRSHQLFHSVKDGASWRRLVHTMFEEEENVHE